jgi:ferredoxin
MARARYRTQLLVKCRIKLQAGGRKNPATFGGRLFGEAQGWPMAYVIAEPCIGVKDTACVDACPVDCIHPKKNSDVR